MSQYMNMLQELILGDSVGVYIVVFLIGFISSLNPHMLGMVPIYVGHMVSSNNQKKLINLILFALSFSIILTGLGVGVSAVGMSLHSIMTISYVMAGLIYLFMGLSLLGLRLSSMIPIEIIVLHSSKKPYRNSVLRNILMPVIFTPCSLPFIVSILTLAMVKGSIIYGGTILFVFGLGHSLIFILFGLFSDVLIRLNDRLNHNKILHRILGVVFVILGIVFISLNQNSSIHNHH
ncbi:cytochrome c biogenesis CcdA family protein [Alkaliphilus oremlandii]|uniref:Cytochrome c biogenesis protein transmembrane region n=1 Tax=Alkaliphilus oremlandii (strain OhILAs) TaxID=350688 RepID=A8MGS5_ALKOO|nr:cytochrome c biogenesis protein CcdA [Alkaliphilus oremlandii]ABW18619.1 cytochrome c biogenesis protein transmembrane region [Alkaliphilus oremlandii OhILAs]